ncbi:transcription elongation factor GreA [Allomeiothermus silvanus]|uniref:transcription elongation factor GreA n=1 Tax=Allomeiothermus silvanus TaxID=52022 RepID=UPI0023F2F154|nr:transcription elongation factor GreA [Allomeiothermus silvanus]
MSQNKPVYLTAEGLKRLQDELTTLKTVKRQEIAAAFEQAIEEGDLRENAGYDEARRAQWDNDRRISELESILARAVVVEAGNGTPLEVGLGVSVELETDTGAHMSLTIVGSHEADVFNGKISNESPMGQRLMGKKVGDRVEYPSPKGVQSYTIVELSYK